MTIVGIGTDMVQLKRIERLHKTYAGRFCQHILMPQEQTQFDALNTESQRVAYLAKRFAAKEAVVKALGTGFVLGMWLKDVGVVSAEQGRPVVVWSERGQAFIQQLQVDHVHISISDERDMALAFAIAERGAS